MKLYLTACLAFLCSISSAEEPDKSSDSFPTHHHPLHPPAQHFNGDQPQVFLQGQPSQKDSLNARAFNNHGREPGQHGQHGQNNQHNQHNQGQHNQGHGGHGQHNRNQGGRRNQGPHLIPGHRVSPNGFGGHPMRPGCAGNPKALAQLIANYVVQFQQQNARDKNKKKGQPNNRKAHKKHPELHPSQSENDENTVPQGFDFHGALYDRSEASEDKPVIQSSRPDDD